MNHIMIDLETMGNESYSSIVSIGAVRFDLETGKTYENFYEKIDLQSCIDAGLIINASTIQWWMIQNQNAQRELFVDTHSLKFVLDAFSYFVTKDDYIWGNSARFDLGILQNAYNKLKIDIPWDFRKELDVRTLVFFNPEIKQKFIDNNKEIVHHSLNDCYFQIKYCCETYKTLNYAKKNN